MPHDPARPCRPEGVFGLVVMMIMMIKMRMVVTIAMAKMTVRMLTEKGRRMRRLKILGDNKNINDDVYKDLQLQAGGRCLEGWTPTWTRSCSASGKKIKDHKDAIMIRYIY